MIIRLLIEVLSRESRIESECPQTARVAVRHIPPERIIIVPSPYHLLRAIGDHAWRIKLVRVYEVEGRGYRDREVNRAGTRRRSHVIGSDSCKHVTAHWHVCPVECIRWGRDGRQ